MAVRADVYDVIADAVNGFVKRGMKGIGVAADGADAECVPCLNPDNLLAVHTAALVDAGKNGYGDTRNFVQMSEYFPIAIVSVPSASCHPSRWLFPVSVSVSVRWFPERTGYLQVLAPSRCTVIPIPSSPGMS